MEYFILVIFLVALVFGYLFYKRVRENASARVKIAEYIVLLGFILSSALFCVGLAMHSADYNTPIDPVSEHYTPFASSHTFTLLTFYSLGVWSLFKLWLRGRNLPPLLFVLNLIFVIICLPVSVAILLQVANSTESSDAFLFFFFPTAYMLIAIIIIVKTVLQQVSAAPSKIYRNKFLNYLNQKMARASMQPVMVIILMVPVFVIVTAILMLFGQDADAIASVFTETTTWHFSQKTHPPFLDHKGHYLCTVAACGDPNIVKPIRLGMRHGKEIIVNRQLQIANAFEELICESSPALHKLVRGVYDKYGYPLSTKITTPKASNLTYWLMKPLEYFFLITLYLFTSKPEEKIKRQYAYTPDKI
jgi:hypothetical protein